MPEPLSKSTEYAHQLIDILKSGELLAEWDLHSWIRNIKALGNSAHEEYLLALAWAAYGDSDKASPLFERALCVESEADVVAKNYLIFVSLRGELADAVKLSWRLSQKFISPEILCRAIYLHLYYGEFAKAFELNRKFLRMVPQAAEQHFSGDLASLESGLARFRSTANMSDAQFTVLVRSVAAIMRKNNAITEHYSFHSLNEEAMNAYVVTVANCNVDRVAAMNLQLALELAEHDELLSLNFSVWFEQGSMLTTQETGQCQ
ncbi:hypothetical protein GKQ23_08765 [Erwinia sp. E602]|uniref:hypothetical protein n=1 Tax=Erwinia sp. E602 TaxID=2675378 RepID=UPI001BA82973|nr:hypothetical protein [Erwinia sp. E602]QUG75075.1 hypothetical protein GKQ23_08765 [Erwinia sp. E602]